MFFDLVTRPFIRLVRCHIMARHKPDSKRIWDGFTYRSTSTRCHLGIYRVASGNWRLSSSAHAPGPVAEIVTARVAPPSKAPPLSTPHEMPQPDLHEATRLIVAAIVILDQLALSEKFASLARVHAQVSLDVLIQEGARIAHASSGDHAFESWRSRLRNSVGVVISD